MARTKKASVPEVGSEAPEFNLPSAQGGNLRLSMRTVIGPVIVAFYRAGSEEDVSYFESLAGKEDEINLALGSIVGIGIAEPEAAREFLKACGMKSYILYDYARVATPAWGLMEKDAEHGDHARPATFLVDTDHKIAHAWPEERPSPEELLEKVSGITGLPKEPEEEEERPKQPAKDKAGADGSPEGSTEGTAEKPERKKLSPEEREKRRAERKAARESAAGESADGETGEAKPAKAEAEPETEGEAEPERKPVEREEKGG